MSSEKDKNNETSEFKKLKLFENINDNNSKGKKVKMNKSEKSSTTEENTNNLEKEEKEKNEKQNNEKANDKNNKNINITENNDSNFKELFPFDNDYIFKDFHEINDIQMNQLNKKKCYTLLKLVKKKKYGKNFFKPIMEKEKEIYKTEIKKPMDLNTLCTNLINDCYKNIGCFLQDYSLIVTNTQNVNEKNSIIFKNAEKIKKFSKKYLQHSFKNEINEQKNKEKILLSQKKEFRKTKEEYKKRNEEENEI